MTVQPTQEYARELDARDELAPFRERFYLPPGRIYLDGNSLGLLSRPAEAATLRALEEWKQLAIDGWLEAPQPWFTLAESLAARTAPLIGAAAEEVIVTNGTTVNLHQLLATLFQPRPGRDRILIDALAFPSDRYAVQSHLRLRGLDPGTHLAIAPSHDGLTVTEDDIVTAMTPDVQAAVLPAVQFRSAQLLDMERLAAEARRRGIVIGFDCSHSIGAVPHRLSAWGADFAFWCSYKYVNGSPGGSGGLYLNRRHFGTAPGLAGWFSSDKERQFEMPFALAPAAGAGCLQIGTPAILAMAPLAGALEILEEAGLDRLRRKSLALTGYLMALADAELATFGFRIGTPREERRRGGHVCLLHPQAPAVSRALSAAGVVQDHRPPEILRLAPVPLYNTFVECREAVRRLREVVSAGRWGDGV